MNDAFTVTITNGTSSPKDFRLFDATTIVSSVTGVAKDTTYTPTVEKDALLNSTYGNPIVLLVLTTKLHRTIHGCSELRHFALLNRRSSGHAPNIIQKAS